MLATRLLICLGSVLLTAPALGAYFVVQEPGTNRCSVTGQSPAPDTGALVGDGAYGEWATAEADMRAIAGCAANRQQEMALTMPSVFFIVQDPGTNRCTIVEQESGSGSVVVFGDGGQGDRPPAPGSPPVVVGDGAYGDRPAAEADMRAIAACATTGQ
jgi:hypothetical protein